MTSEHHRYADNTPIIVGAGQCVERLVDASLPPFSAPAGLAAEAARRALADAGCPGQVSEIDTVAVVRLFSDTVPTWASPLGGSDNLPESVARRIGAAPSHRLYSNAGGNQPLALLAEMFAAIARGEKSMVLLAGAEAIASQRHAARRGLEEDWREHWDAPLEDRPYRERSVTPEELRSGLKLPAHYYALIENRQAWQMGHDRASHQQHMADLLAPFIEVAARNPFAQHQQQPGMAQIAEDSPANFPLCLPYRRRMVAQDAVNQGAALLLTSAGNARRLGIDPQRWIFLQAYAEAGDGPLMLRPEPAASAAMQAVMRAVLEQAAEQDARAFDLIDIYSCFPCAVQAACDCLGLASVDGPALTVTGGLPFFGGPGNNYSMHAVAEMVTRLRTKGGRALVTANGGQLSHHAAAVLGRTAARDDLPATDWASQNREAGTGLPPARPICEDPRRGTVVSETVIHRRDRPDLAVVLCETGAGERFLARSEESSVIEAMAGATTIGRPLQVETRDQRHFFSFAD